MDDRIHALLQLTGWAERGWIVTLQAVLGRWVVIVKTRHAFEMDVPNPRSGTMGLRFNTAPYETPEEAIAAAAQVLR